MLTTLGISRQFRDPPPSRVKDEPIGPNRLRSRCVIDVVGIHAPGSATEYLQWQEGNHSLETKKSGEHAIMKYLLCTTLDDF